MKRFLATGLLLGAALLPTLQGCLPMVAAGATGGALATMDRRSLGTQTDDETIEWKASARVNEKFGETSHTNFTSYNRKVLITGEVASETDKAEIERLVSGVPQVQGVYNELAIGPVTSFSSRSPTWASAPSGTPSPSAASSNTRGAGLHAPTSSLNTKPSKRSSRP